MEPQENHTAMGAEGPHGEYLGEGIVDWVTSAGLPLGPWTVRMSGALKPWRARCLAGNVPRPGIPGEVLTRSCMKDHFLIAKHRQLSKAQGRVVRELVTGQGGSQGSNRKYGLKSPETLDFPTPGGPVGA